MTYTLVLVRHGESDWNAKNLFTGWVDVDLTDKGRAEGVSAGEQLKEAGILPDIVHTSLLRRAITTANLSLDAADRHWIPVKRDWRLNERHYGALQGKNKKQTLEEFGEEKFMQWRRSYDVPPPPIDDGRRVLAAGDPRYAGLGAAMPATECLKDVVDADDALLGERDPDRPRRRPDRHGRRPRQLAACPGQDLDGISDDDIAGLNIPTGMPLVYELDDSFRPVTPGGRYLDPEAAAAPRQAVANQGR